MTARVIKLYSENNDFQYIDALRRKREKRHRQREFFVEGVRSINQAIAQGWTISAYIYARDKRLSDWAADILRCSSAALHFELPEPLMEKLSQKADPSELLALVAMPDDCISRIPLHADLLVVIFDRPSNPGNLGAIIRSCDALRAHGLVITGHAVDLYDPETISAATGSLFALPVVRQASAGDLLPWLAHVREMLGQVQVVGSSAKATDDLSNVDFRGPTILVIGNETWGLSAAYQELCDVLVRIPMYGSASSLNVACATSILLYEVTRQRRIP